MGNIKIYKKGDRYQPVSDYDKYEKKGDLHWQWYNESGHEYKKLVDESVAPFLTLPEVGTLVDIGCGDGLPMSLLVDHGFECHGVDSSELGIKIALYQHNVNGEYFIEQAEKFAERNLEYDYLYSLNTIEHLDRPECMREIMKRVHKFGIIVTDNLDNRGDSSVYHHIEFTPESFIELFKGFGIERIPLTNEKYMAFKVWNL